MPFDQHASLTCRAVGTKCLSVWGYDGVFSCTTLTCISRQTRVAPVRVAVFRAGSCRSVSSLVTSTILVVNHTGAQCSKRSIPWWSILRHNVSLTRSPVRLIILSREMLQPSEPSYHTTQSNKPHLPPAVYIYSGRTSSSVIHTEARLGERT
jgi:hypothetical protein